MGSKVRATGILFLLIICSPRLNETHAQSRQVRQYTIEEFLGTTNYAGASFSSTADKLLVSSDEPGIFNAFAVPVDGGEPVQLTHSTDDAVFAVSYFPADDRFVYTSDQGGNELNHVYVQDEDGVVTDLTPGDSLKAAFYGWADDDQSFLVGSTERDPRFFDVYEYDTDDYERSLLQGHLGLS